MPVVRSGVPRRQPPAHRSGWTFRCGFKESPAQLDEKLCACGESASACLALVPVDRSHRRLTPGEDPLVAGCRAPPPASRTPAMRRQSHCARLRWRAPATAWPAPMAAYAYRSSQGVATASRQEQPRRVCCLAAHLGERSSAGPRPPTIASMSRRGGRPLAQGASVRVSASTSHTPPPLLHRLSERHRGRRRVPSRRIDLSTTRAMRHSAPRGMTAGCRPLQKGPPQAP